MLAGALALGLLLSVPPLSGEAPERIASTDARRVTPSTDSEVRVRSPGRTTMTLSARDRFEALFEPPRSSGSSDVEPSPTERSTSMLWLLYREMYCERLRTRHPGEHAEHTAAILDRFTRYRRLQDRRLDQITAADLEQYVAARRGDQWRGKPLSPRTINNEISTLNACLAFAGPRTQGAGRKRLALLPDPPYCELLPEPELAPVCVSEDRITRFLHAARLARTPRLDGCSPRSFWFAVTLLERITLLRRGALLRIPRPDEAVLIEQRQLFLPAALNKARSDQWISLGSRHDVVEVLASLPSRVGEPLLPWRSLSGQPMTLSHLNRTMVEFQLADGVPRSECLRLKDLRSTGATQVGDEYGDAVAKRKLKHSPQTNTFNVHYKSRECSAEEVRATDWLVERFLRAAGAGTAPPELQVVG